MQQVFPCNIQTQCVKVHIELRGISSLNFKTILNFEKFRGKICHIFHLCPISCLLLLVSISNVEGEQKVLMDHFCYNSCNLALDNFILISIFQYFHININIDISIGILLIWCMKSSSIWLWVKRRIANVEVGKRKGQIDFLQRRNWMSENLQICKNLFHQNYFLQIFKSSR